jgi:uncharacterized protein YcbX
MTNYYADVLDGGRVRACLPCEDDTPLHQWHGQAEGSLVLLDAPIDWISPTPTAELHWSAADGLHWIDTASVEHAQANAWAAVKQARDAAEAAPFEFEGGMYDPNKENVSGAALAALLAQLGGVEVSRTWTLADNSRRVLTGAQIIAMGLALTARVDAIHERGRTLRDLIDNATTPAEAYGHTWSSLDA